MDINFESMQDLHITISTAFYNALAAAPPVEWPTIARKFGSSSDHNVYPFLGEMPGMREWLGPRIAHELKSHRYSIENRKWEATLKGMRTEIEDDQGGMAPLYASRSEIMARAVAVHPDELVIGEALVQGDSTPCYDGQNFFDTDHPNDNAGGVASNDMGGSGPAWYLFDTSKPLSALIYQLRQATNFRALFDLNNPHTFMLDEFLWGADQRDAAGYGLWQCALRSKQTLSEANFLAARQTMHTYANDQGRNMRIDPDIILVPRGTALADTAHKLFDLQYASVSGGSTQNNYLYKAIRVVESNYLPKT